jgi:hypothetical protein
MDARLRIDTHETGLPRPALRLPAIEVREQLLPFTVRAATSAQDLGMAVSIRHSAYGRHVPALAEQLRMPEQLDTASGCTVLLAESKLDGEPIGTLRIQTNRYRPLALESSVTLPRSYAGCSLAEATRLGVANGRVGYAVKIALFKAFYLLCIKANVDWMVITARAPLERMYEGLLFGDVFPGETARPMRHVGNIPHRVLSFEVGTAEERWREVNHPLYDHFVRTRHADIDIEGAGPLFEAPSPVFRRPMALVA